MDYSKTWDKMNAIIESDVNCEECHDHGLINFSGFRDHFRTGIKGKPFDPPNYERFVKEVICVFEKYKRRA